MEMYKEIRSNVIDKLVSMAGKKHGICFLEGGKQTTRYEAGRRLLFGVTL
jgi:singapore isolate B (sub-type 7) whole genome shotgun sequence assembly, scaffold_10